ncbi:hypothetical protein [Aliivibrio salmonicida]|uniref:hypothetical protein n=1 Tax=Aliivibrio salmonicida TaxID=40269 RepID=UPI003D10EF5D
MTNSTVINSTITKEIEATNVSSFELSGSNKNECIQSKEQVCDCSEDDTCIQCYDFYWESKIRFSTLDDGSVPSFLSVFGKEDLILKSIEGNITVVIHPPKNGWIYEALKMVDFFDINFQYAVFSSWNIYIGGCYVGCDDDWLNVGEIEIEVLDNLR